MMRKFCYKKSVSQEESPILQRLERRHTVADAVADEIGSCSHWHEMVLKGTTGRQSVSEQQTASTSARSVSSELGSGSELSPLSTLIITDSDLVSSWIYSSKKAAANEAFEQDSDDHRSPKQNGHASGRTTDEVERSPRPDLKPIPIAPRGNSYRYSCCCYLFVMLIIFVCIFGILSAVGGIVYLELFAYHSVANIKAEVTSILHTQQETTELNTYISLTDTELAAASTNTEATPSESSDSKTSNIGAISIVNTRFPDTGSYTKSPALDTSEANIINRESRLVDSPELSNLPLQEQNIPSNSATMPGGNLVLNATSILPLSSHREPREVGEGTEFDNSTSNVNKINSEQGSSTSKITNNLRADGFRTASTAKSRQERATTSNPRESIVDIDLPLATNTHDNKLISETPNFKTSETFLTKEPSGAVTIRSKPSNQRETSKVLNLQSSDATPKRHGTQFQDENTNSKLNETRLSSGDLQESIVRVMKRFQALGYSRYPNSRIKESNSAVLKRKGIITAGTETSAEAEKEQYLDKLRILIFNA